MRVRRIVTGIAAAIVAVALIGSSLAATGRPWNEPVKITNKTCVLGYARIGRQYTHVVFGVFNNGSVPHGFDLGAHIKSGLVKPHQEKTLITNLAPGAYTYACVSAHSTLKRGVFRIG
jgi:hypothetical protein